MAHAVLTRDPASAAAYAAALAPLGLDVVAMPVTRHAPAADPRALDRALDAQYAAIVVASPRAAHELARAAAGRALPEVWAVGPATLRALAIAKIAARHPDGARDGAELARRLVASRPLRGQRVLVPRAEEGRVEALELLRAAGADVVDVVAYRTLPVPPGDPALARGAELLAAGRAAVCAVFAPSQVAALAAVTGPLGELATAFCAIGETTAAAVRAAGVARVAVAPEPTPAGIARAVRSVYSPRT
ncbi:MAG TPA: uroporphyrinogen-III synthase [Kofleriaceae bacterium]|nr:uroporphyrinogen-III synthase [Kofleriaceae bacterium]